MSDLITRAIAGLATLAVMPIERLVVDGIESVRPVPDYSGPMMCYRAEPLLARAHRQRWDLPEMDDDDQQDWLRGWNL